MSNLFQKIIDKELDADIIYEDDQCLAFRDINPHAPVHVLIIPKKPIAKLLDSTADDAAILGHLMVKAAEVAKQEGLGDDCRFVINNGAKSGQSVFHLHVHILGGRGFSWPPG